MRSSSHPANPARHLFSPVPARKDKPATLARSSHPVYRPQTSPLEPTASTKNTAHRQTLPVDPRPYVSREEKTVTLARSSHPASPRPYRASAQPHSKPPQIPADRQRTIRQTLPNTLPADTPSALPGLGKRNRINLTEFPATRLQPPRRPPPSALPGLGTHPTEGGPPAEEPRIPRIPPGPRRYRGSGTCSTRIPRAPACHVHCCHFGAIAPRGRGRATPAPPDGQRLS